MRPEVDWLSAHTQLKLGVNDGPPGAGGLREGETPLGHPNGVSGENQARRTISRHRQIANYRK